MLIQLETTVRKPFMNSFGKASLGLTMLAYLMLSSCSNDTSSSSNNLKGAETKLGLHALKVNSAEDNSKKSNHSILTKILSKQETKIKFSTSYKDIPFEFSLTDKVNEFGRMISTSQAYEKFAIVNDLTPAPQTSPGQPPFIRASPMLSINSFVSSSEMSFHHCFAAQASASAVSSAPVDSQRFPGMFAQYGIDAVGHWVFVNRLLANTTGPNDAPIWHRVEVISEVLSIQGKQPIQLPKSEQGMRFSTWMVSKIPYSIKSSVVLHPESAFAGSSAEAPVALAITTSWGLPRVELNVLSKSQNEVLTFSQVWECEEGTLCPKIVNDAPLYWYEETFAKGLGRSWKIEDKLTRLIWNGSGWRKTAQATASCGI